MRNFVVWLATRGNGAPDYQKHLHDHSDSIKPVVRYFFLRHATILNVEKGLQVQVSPFDMIRGC